MRTSRTVLTILLCACVNVCAFSQDILPSTINGNPATIATEREWDIWKKSSPIIISYGSQTYENKTLGYEQKSNFSIGFSKRNTFFLHRQAIAGMVKIGLDVTWTDVTFARYAKGNFSFNQTLEDIRQNLMDLDVEEPFNGEDISKSFDIGTYAISIGLFGVGPSVHVIPFYYLDNQSLDKLKLTLYFHYQPSFMLRLESGDKWRTEYGYIGQWRYGAYLSYSRIGIGVEHYWGQGKLFGNSFSKDFATDKVDSSISGTRFYIGFKL